MTDISALLSDTLSIAPELALVVVAVAMLAVSASRGKGGGNAFFLLAAGGVAAAFVLELSMPPSFLNAVRVSSSATRLRHLRKWVTVSSLPIITPHTS